MKQQFSTRQTQQWRSGFGRFMAVFKADGHTAMMANANCGSNIVVCATGAGLTFANIAFHDELLSNPHR